MRREQYSAKISDMTARREENLGGFSSKIAALLEAARRTHRLHPGHPGPQRPTPSSSRPCSQKRLKYADRRSDPLSSNPSVGPWRTGNGE